MPHDQAFIHSQRIDRHRCPVCGQEKDAVTSVSFDADDERPEPKIGDILVCAYCCTPLMRTTIGDRPATEAELKRLSPRQWAIMMAYIADHHRGRVS